MADVAQRIPLVADPDEIFLADIERRMAGALGHPETVSSAEEFRARIGTNAGAYSCILLNSRLGEPAGVPLVRIVRERCPATPVYLLMDPGASALTPLEMRMLTVKDAIHKPIVGPEIIGVLAAPASQEQQHGFTPDKEEVEVVSMEHPEAEVGFVPVQAMNFVPGMPTYFDVFVRLSGERYVKILHAGDSIAPERISMYRSRGVDTFYLRKKVYERYLEYCDSLCSALLARDDVSAEVKARQVAGFGEETAAYLRARGVNETAITFARQFAHKSVGLVRKLGLDRHDAVKHLLETATELDHSVSTAMIASLLAAPLNFQGERSVSVLGLAAILHDVGLQNTSERILQHDPAILTGIELEIYRKHPLIGEQIVRGFPEVEPVVARAIAQHHERAGGGGFPNHLPAGKIDLVAEIIGISEEFSLLLKKNANRAELHPRLEMEKCLSQFSSTVASTFRLFFANKL